MNSSTRAFPIRRGFPVFPLLLWILFATNGLAAVNRWSTNGPAGGEINCLALDPGDPRVLYAGSYQSGVFKSIDGGLSWSVSRALSPGDTLSALAIDSLSTSTVYAATAVGLLKSVDAGAGWVTLRPGLPARFSSAYALATNPASSSIIFAGTDNGIYKSGDGGFNWKTSNYLQAASIYSLAVSPRNSAAIYAADLEFPDLDYMNPESKVYATRDDGATWSQVGSLPGISQGALAIDPARPSTLYAGTYQGFYKSVDAGATWNVASSDLGLAHHPGANIVVTAVAIDPDNSGTLYAGTSDQGIFRSVDGGTRWAPFNTGLTNLSISTLSIDRTGTRLHAGTAAGVFDYQIPPSGALDLSVGPDDNIDIVSGDGQGRALFQTLDRSENSARSGPFGPYSGWLPTAISSGMDGLTRVLWTNEEGSAALWLMSGHGVEASRLLDRPSGLLATDVASSAAGVTHVLWADADGRIAITSIDNSGPRSTGPIYGPYHGWAAVAAADGPDGRTRVLWRNLDGATAISFAQDGRLLVSQSFAAVAGWTALDIAAGGDGLTRILWSHQDNRTALWIVDSEGQVTTRGPIYSAPAGMSASRLAAGVDGSARVLFTDAQGGVILWLLSSTGVFQSAFDLARANPAGAGIAGTWTGTFSSDNIEFCAFSGIPARATLMQDGSAVWGVLDAPTAPCFDLESRAFTGTLEGNTLTGSDGGFGFVQGTVSGTTLEIGLGINSFGYASEGRLHLHR